jgi:pimeloyl-ACP methyl ester carboxylesterase
LTEILLIHGAGGGAWQWAAWQAEFTAQGLANTALTLTPRADLAATTLADYQAQVLAATAHYSQPPVLIGASLGGLLALWAATQGKVAALVLVNAVPPGATPGWPPAPRRFPRIIRWQDGAPQATHAALPDTSAAVAARVHQQWRNESGQVMQHLWDGVSLELPQVPTLVIAGAGDGTVPPTCQAALATQLGADFYRCAGVSHLGALLGERASQLAALTAAWLRLI